MALGTYDVTATWDEFECTGEPAGGLIYGQVTTYADQEPAAGAIVETYHSFDGYPSVALASAITDAQGRYELTGLPPAEKGYWVRAVAEGMGGGTGWFVTVDERRPTKVDLALLRPPEASVWVDSQDAASPAVWEAVEDPQCYGGSRSVVRAGEPPDPLRVAFETAGDGSYTLHIASGLHAQPHYWSAFEWRIDEGEWQDASSTLTIEGARYGDRLSLTWARTTALRLDTGRHQLELRPSGAWTGGGEYYWTFDALAVTQLPEPSGPEVAETGRPTLQWSGEGEVVLQLSHEPDFSDGTLTVPHLSGGEWQPEAGLPDGDYWCRLKPEVSGPSMFAGAFGTPAMLTIETEAPGITSCRDRAYAPDRAVVRWETDEACESWLEWDCSTVDPRYRTPVSHGTEHVARLPGLEGHACYRYWVVTRSREGIRRSLRRQFMTPRGKLEGRQSPFGVFGQGLTYGKRFGEAGVKWMSDYWDWKTLEPAEGHFDWSHAEERMKLAREAGLDITVTFWGSPDWIRPSHVGEHSWDFTHGPEDLSAASEFFRRLATHCRGRVDWFLPWIEPNVGRDPVFGFPRGYWASRPHAESYAAYEQAAYVGAKQGNPDARVVGMNTAGVDIGFIERCYDEGAADAFDVMNVHYYAPTRPFEEQNPEALFGRLRALMAEYGDAEKPIICSEGGGASSGLDGTDEQSQARNLVRIYVLSIANDISHLSWTFSHDVKPYGSKQVDMIMWMGLFRHDPDPTHAAQALAGEPKPAYFALGNMAGLLEGSEYQRRVRLGEGIRAYRFEREGERITVVWSEGEPATVRLPAMGEVRRCVDHMGEAVGVTREGDRVVLEATEAPVFVVEGRAN